MIQWPSKLFKLILIKFETERVFFFEDAINKLFITDRRAPFSGGPKAIAPPPLIRLWVRASAAGAVDLGMIPSRVKPMTLKLVFTASLLDVQH